MKTKTEKRKKEEKKKTFQLFFLFVLLCMFTHKFITFSLKAQTTHERYQLFSVSISIFCLLLLPVFFALRIRTCRSAHLSHSPSLFCFYTLFRLECATTYDQQNELEQQQERRNDFIRIVSRKYSMITSLQRSPIVSTFDNQFYNEYEPNVLYLPPSSSKIIEF